MSDRDQARPRQDSILKTLAERGPMKYSDLSWSQDTLGGIKESLDKLLRRDLVVKEFGYYRLPDQEIPPALLTEPTKVYITTPSREQILKIKMEERDAMRKDLEKVRLTLVDVKVLITSIIDALTPSEFAEDKGK